MCDTLDVKKLLNFLFFGKQRNWKEFHCPSVFINAGSHLNNFEKNVFQSNNPKISDKKIVK